jgi:hypothetical protein
MLHAAVVIEAEKACSRSAICDSAISGKSLRPGKSHDIPRSDFLIFDDFELSVANNGSHSGETLITEISGVIFWWAVPGSNRRPAD